MTYLHTTVDCADHHELVRDFDGPRPQIVVLCGSTRFKEAFTVVNRQLSLDGHIVLSVGLFAHSDLGGHTETVLGAEVKAGLDELHLRKVDLADRVFVINCDGYVGESTRREIAYAVAHGKPVEYLVPAELGGKSARQRFTRLGGKLAWPGGYLDIEGRPMQWVLVCPEHGQIGRRQPLTAVGHDGLVRLWAQHEHDAHDGDGEVDESRLLGAAVPR